MHEVFDDGATEAALNHADGVPRVLNRICSMGMTIAASEGKRIVDVDAINKAINDIRLG